MIGAKRYPDSREGGIDIVVQKLSEELVKLGHQVTVLVRTKKGFNPPKEHNGVNIKKIFTINTKLTDALIYSFFATKYAKKHDFDIVHFHAEGNTLFLKKLKKNNNKRIIVTIHGLDWKRGKFKGIGAKMLLKSEKVIVKYSDDIITLCENDNLYFQNKYGITTFLIPNGFEKKPYFWPNVIKSKYNLNYDSYILFLARIVPEKGLHFLVDAYNRILDPKPKLVVAGGSSHSKKYYEEIKKKIGNNRNIILTGFVEGDELYELLGNTFLYVLPSTIEGMPLSLIEALSFDRICLCSDIDELKNINSKNIVYFKNQSVDDLQNKLTSIIKNKPHFNHESLFLEWKEVANKTINVYKGKEEK